MDVQSLKEYILDNEKLPETLQEIGCHSIHDHGGYITCGNKTGDNKSAIVIYLNENLTVVNYTRTMTSSKRTTDIFDLICYNEDYSFPEALKFCCNLFGLDYYQEPEEVPESLQILKMLQQMATEEDDFDDTPLKPIPEKILSYYLPYGNKLWEDDGISLSTQKLFEVSFDPMTNSIAIPIRDEIGTLVGIKARRMEYDPDSGMSKYFFLEPCAKSRILYGLFQNIKFIQHTGTVWVGESEKFVQQLYDMGYYGVSTGGTKISKNQVEMLTRLNAKIVFCYDEDVDEEQLKNISNMFLNGIPVYAIIDKDHILDNKESPSDNPEKFKYLIKNNIYSLREDNDE